jgi:hypothetical protein
MNMAYNLDQNRDFDYQNEEQASSSGREKTQRKAQPSYARKRTPSAYNGIHRRRNKRFSW